MFFCVANHFQFLLYSITDGNSSQRRDDTCQKCVNFDANAPKTKHSLSLASNISNKMIGLWNGSGNGWGNGLGNSLGIDSGNGLGNGFGVGMRNGLGIVWEIVWEIVWGWFVEWFREEFEK